MSNLILFPPSFLLVQLFRRSKMRISRNQILKDSIEKFKKKEYSYENEFDTIDQSPVPPTHESKEKIKPKNKKKKRS